MGKMIKQLSLIALLSMLSSGVFAQYANQYLYTGLSSNMGAYEVPSLLGEDIRTLEVRLLGIRPFFGTSVTNVNSVYNYATFEPSAGQDSSYLVRSILTDFLKNSPDNNFVSAGVSVFAPLSVTFKVKTGEDKKELATFSFNHRVRVASSLHFGKGLAQLAWEGNREYLGETINLADYYINAHAWAEFGVGAAFPIMDLNDMISLRGGFNVKYLNGFGALYTERSELNFTTASDARYVDLGLDYRINAALPFDPLDSTEDGGNVDPTVRLGTGLGFDFGVTAKILDNIKASIAFNDIGGIGYSNGVYNYYGDTTVRFEGVDVDLFNIDESFEFDPDTLLDLIEPTQSNNSFRMPLPTRMVLHGSMGLQEKETKKGMKYYSHNVYFTYIQGFNRSPGNSLRPFLNAGYTYDLKHFLTVGGNLGWGGVYGANIGMHLSLRGGPLRFGIGSNSALGLLIPTSAQGTDFWMNLSIAI